MDLPVAAEQLLERGRVVPGDVAGQTMGGREEVVVGDDVVDQTESMGLLGVDEVAGERHLDGAA